MADENDAIAAFGAALKEHGFNLEGQPIMDGEWQRARVEGDKGSKRSGSYRGFLDGGKPRGIINNFKGGDPVTWVGEAERVPPAVFKRQMDDARQKREQQAKEREATQREVARKAYGIFTNAASAPADHPYLIKKGVEPYGVKIDRYGRLLVPLRDREGFLWGVQLIDQNGRKSFLEDSRKAGLFHVLGEPAKLTGKGPIILAEGYATGATLHKETGITTIVAFDGGNLPAVAATVHSMKPDRFQIIGADDDHNAKEDNPGRKAAAKALNAVNEKRGAAMIIVPPFSTEEKKAGLTDWNDLALKRGGAAIKEALSDPRIFERETHAPRQVTQSVSQKRCRDFGL
ncbi:toprim domain-containing protein [Nisaea sp.]|uniref:toprim domain-containing protein n=1 Tax=Nisaea sp. TaxID=2024842 RepID=UPI003262FEE3